MITKRLQLAACVAHVDAHYAERIDAGKLAELCGSVTRGYLSRSWRAAFDMTLQDYVKMRRMEAARELLMRPRMKLEEVAGRCGFYDARHFGREFKAYHGIQPSVWRQLHAQDNTNTNTGRLAA